MMHQRLHRPISTLLAVTLFAGCAATPDGRKTQAQGTAIGVVGGAVLGGLLGYAVGGRNGMATGAIAGAVVGGAAGYKWGSDVAHRKATYANREAWLDACIGAAHRVNANTYAYTRTLEGRIARLESRTRAAKASRNRAQLVSLKREVASVRAEARVKDVEVSKEIGNQQEVIHEGKGSPKYGRLQTEVHTLEQTKGTLGKQVNRLAGLENQLDV